MPSVASQSIWGGNVAWVVVFLANLIVPLRLGWEVTGNGGRVGMIAATAFMLLLTLLVVPKSSELRMTLVAGSIFTAITQTLPLIQFIAGVLSLVIVRLMGLLEESGSGLTEPGGFLATLFTAWLMMAVAFLSGVFLRAVGRDADRRREAMVAWGNPTIGQSTAELGKQQV